VLSHIVELPKLIPELWNGLLHRAAQARSSVFPRQKREAVANLEQTESEFVFEARKSGFVRES
jgi:hypothetical protein